MLSVSCQTESGKEISVLLSIFLHFRHRTRKRCSWTTKRAEYVWVDTDPEQQAPTTIVKTEQQDNNSPSRYGSFMSRNHRWSKEPMKNKFNMKCDFEHVTHVTQINETRMWPEFIHTLTRFCTHLSHRQRETFSQIRHNWRSSIFHWLPSQHSERWFLWVRLVFSWCRNLRRASRSDPTVDLQGHTRRLWMLDFSPCIPPRQTQVPFLNFSLYPVHPIKPLSSPLKDIYCTK